MWEYNRNTRMNKNVQKVDGIRLNIMIKCDILFKRH